MAKRRRKVPMAELAEMVAQGEARLHQQQEAAAALAAPPTAAEWASMTPLDRLAVLRQAKVEVLAEMEHDIRSEVATARSAGSSWHAIGRVFDLTGEGARQRWGA